MKSEDLYSQYAALEAKSRDQIEDTLNRMKRVSEMHQEIFDVTTCNTERLESLHNTVTQLQRDSHYMLQQVGEQTGGILRKVEELSDDFVHMNVKVPLLWEVVLILGHFLPFCDALPELQAGTDFIKNILDAHDAQVILPEPGTLLDLKLHKPILTTPSEDRQLHRTIVALVRPGLVCRDRTIKPALVNIYITKISTTHQTENTNENANQES